MDEYTNKTKRLRNFFRLGLAISSLTTTAFVFLLFLLVSERISFRSPSLFVAFNLSDQELFVNDQRVPIYDSFTAATNVRNSFTIKSANEEEIFKKTVPEIGSTSTKLTLFVNSEVKYCFFSADVSSFYYETESIQDTLVNVSILNKTGAMAVDMALDFDSYFYIHPGKYSSSQLPTNLVDKKLIGVYPIKCEDVENPDKQKSVVSFYKDFNSSEQREFYTSKVEPLEEQLSN